MQIVTPQFRSPQSPFTVSKPSRVIRKRQKCLGILHHLFFENLAPLHRRPLIINGPQEQVIDDVAAKRNQLSILNLSRDTLND